MRRRRGGRSLGLAADGRPAAEILPRVGSLDLLLVLDNAEHVIDAAAATAERILAGGSAARVLATSRERLAVDGEHVWSVAPLATVGPDAPAARLFRERASAVGAAPDDAVVTRIVQRLDGLPLAIEMAAAQLDTTTGDELADALDEHLDALRSPRRQVAGPPPQPRRRAGVVRSRASTSARPAPSPSSPCSPDRSPPATSRECSASPASPTSCARWPHDRSSASTAPARRRGSTCCRPSAPSPAAASPRPGAPRRWPAAMRSGSSTSSRAADAQLRTVEERRRPRAVRVDLRRAARRARVGGPPRHRPRRRAVGPPPPLRQSRFVEEPLLWAELLLPRLPADHPHRPVLLASVAVRAPCAVATSPRRAGSPAEALAQAGDTPDGHSPRSTC